MSGTGGWIKRIAQDWLVLTITGSPTAVGIVTALQFAPTILLGLHGGLLADRLPKRALLLATQVSTSLTAAALAVLTLSGVVQVWHVYGLALLFTLLLVFIGSGAVGGPVVGWLAEAHGARVALLVSGAVPALVTVLVCRHLAHLGSLRVSLSTMSVRLPRVSVTPRA